MKEQESIKKIYDVNYIEEYEQIIYSDWKYYEHYFFDEDEFEDTIRTKTGYFNYDDLYEEIEEYIKVYVWIKGWEKFLEGDL